MIFGRKKTCSNPSVAVEMNPEGKIDIICQWPEVKSREEAEKAAKEVAYLVVNTYKKEIMPYIQTAIASHGVKTNSEKMANLILIYINNVINPDVTDDNAPVVPPRHAFQVRGE